MDNRTCTIVEDGEQCTRPYRCRDMCKLHYDRSLRLGTPYLPDWPERPIPPERLRASPDLPGERWLPVPDWQRLYEVSNKGRVKSLLRRTPKGVRGGRMLKASVYDRYRLVVLQDGARKRRVFVHQLVLEAFAGACPEGCETLHGPGGPLDNRWPENLRWGTPVENAADKLRDGTDPRGEKQGSHKLTEAQVLEIRRRYAAGEPLRILADEFGVSSATIGSCATGKNWAWLGTPAERRGHEDQSRGSANPNAKLAEADVRLVRSAYAAGGVTYNELASRFGVSRGLIGHIVRGVIWEHVA